MAKKQITKMTPQQEVFCYQYVLLLNGTKAAIEAGYSKRTAGAMAYELIQRPHIKERIEQMKSDLAATAGISALRVLKEHENVAFSSIGHYHKTWMEKKEFEDLTDMQKSAIKTIQTQLRKKNIGSKDKPELVTVEYVRIELYDKLKSLEAIANMLGFNAPEKREVTGKDGKDLIPDIDFGKLTDEELKQYHELIKKVHE